MTLILIHSPKGGVGTTFLTANLAMQLAQNGRHVTAIDFTCQESLKLHFGMLPSQPLVDMTYRAGDAMVVGGVDLLSGARIAREQRFIDLLAGEVPELIDPERITVADVASGDTELKARLLRHAVIHICPLSPTPAALATLPLVEPGTPTKALEKTAFVLNLLDDTRRLSRHTHSFLRELFGGALIGTVRRDEAVNEALASFEPVAKFAPSSVIRADIERLARAVEERLGLTGGEEQAEAATAGPRR
jgi:chromosome partitioning protein